MSEGGRKRGYWTVEVSSKNNTSEGGREGVQLLIEAGCKREAREMGREVGESGHFVNALWIVVYIWLVSEKVLEEK